MTGEIALRSPAKINWTLDVLGRRDDGYHEVRTILQTIGLFDTVRLTLADELTISVRGGTRGLRRHARENPESNLAFRAAQLLKMSTGYDRGAAISLQKHVPVASGLGGGSSNAAAVLRGLRQLWSLDIDDTRLTEIASELGSDVPFFLRGGTAIASGRGEAIEPLPDIPTRSLLLAWPPAAIRADKTARMYGALRNDHFSDGTHSAQLQQRLNSSQPLRDDDLGNAFETVLSDIAPGTARTLELISKLEMRRPHLCGSGPALFLLDGTGEDIWSLAAIHDLGLATITCPTTVSAAEATEIL